MPHKSMLTTPQTPVVTFLNEIRDKNVVTMLELDASVIEQRPPAIIFAAVGKNHVELINDALEARARHQGLYLALDHSNGEWIQPNFPLSNLLAIADKERKILFANFAEHRIQRRPVAIVIATTGQRNVEIVRNRLIPVLESTALLNKLNSVDKEKGVSI